MVVSFLFHAFQTCVPLMLLSSCSHVTLKLLSCYSQVALKCYCQVNFKLLASHLHPLSSAYSLTTVEHHNALHLQSTCTNHAPILDSKTMGYICDTMFVLLPTLKLIHVSLTRMHHRWQPKHDILSKGWGQKPIHLECRIVSSKRSSLACVQDCTSMMSQKMPETLKQLWLEFSKKKTSSMVQCVLGTNLWHFFKVWSFNPAPKRETCYLVILQS